MALQAMCAVRERGQAGNTPRQKRLYGNVGRARVSPLLRPALTTVLLHAQVVVALFTASSFRTVARERPDFDVSDRVCAVHF